MLSIKRRIKNKQPNISMTMRNENRDKTSHRSTREREDVGVDRIIMTVDTIIIKLRPKDKYSTTQTTLPRKKKRTWNVTHLKNRGEEAAAEAKTTTKCQIKA